MRSLTNLHLLRQAVSPRAADFMKMGGLLVIDSCQVAEVIVDARIDYELKFGFLTENLIKTPCQHDLAETGGLEQFRRMQGYSF